MNLEGFRLKYARVESVEDAVFMRIKESVFLDSCMPPSLVWMEESVQGQRYYAHSAQRVALDTSMVGEAWEVVGKLLAQQEVYFADFYSYYVEHHTLYLAPNSFSLGSCKNYNVFKKMVTPGKGLTTKDLEEAQQLAEKDFEFIFGGGPLPKTPRRFGWVKPNGEIDFDRLRPELKAYSNRLDTMLRNYREELSELSGKVILRKIDVNDGYRNQYSLDPAIIAQELPPIDDDSSSSDSL